MSEALIQVENLHKVYHDGERELEVLRGIDATFAPGEVTAIVGSSGSGKSTFLNLIGALDRPSEGRILFQGKDLANLGGSILNRIRRRNIGFIFQFHHLLPELTALENVMLPAQVDRQSREAAEKRARDLLGKAGLAERTRHIPSKLSGGEQQRVALARALMNDPELVLADEPTGNLDAEMGKQVIDLLWAMTRERGKTLLIVTHEPEIAALADRTLRLKEGRLLPQ